MGELVRMTNGDALPVPVEVTCPNHGFEQVSLAPEGQTADFQIENLKTAPLLQEMQQMREALQTMLPHWYIDENRMPRQKEILN